MNYCIVLAVQDPDFGVQLPLKTFPCPFSLVSYEAFYSLRTYQSWVCTWATLSNTIYSFSYYISIWETAVNEHEIVY